MANPAGESGNEPLRLDDSDSDRNGSLGSENRQPRVCRRDETVPGTIRTGQPDPEGLPVCRQNLLDKLGADLREGLAHLG